MAESSRDFGRDIHNRPRAVVEAALNPNTMPSRPATDIETTRISEIATRQGLLYAAAAATLSGSLVFAANALMPRFRGLNVSAKTALVVTPTLAAFAAKSHLELARATMDPSAYTVDHSKAASVAASVGPLPLWQRAANMVYNNPFKTIVGAVTPLYAAIFRYESTSPATASMMLSQRLIHTRVYGQAIAIGVTVSVMMVCESMKTNGPYVERQLAPEVTLTAEQVYNTPVASDDSYGPNNGLLVPLFYAPLLPLMIIGLRSRVQKATLHKIVVGTVLVALSHAGSVMFSDSSVI